MTRTNFILSGALSAAMFAGGFAIAQLPVNNISAQKHPNLSAAQRLSQQAFERISASERV